MSDSRKASVLKFVRANKRWPDQRVKDEAPLYRWLKKYSRMDWVFREEISPYKYQQPGSGKRKGPKKGSKYQSRESTELKRLGLFLMDSGGTGQF